MPIPYDVPDVAVRIVEFQLAWLRMAGLLSVVIAAFVAMGVGASVVRLIRQHTGNPKARRRRGQTEGRATAAR